jgi:hypothetical protein
MRNAPLPLVMRIQASRQHKHFLLATVTLSLVALWLCPLPIFWQGLASVILLWGAAKQVNQPITALRFISSEQVEIKVEQSDWQPVELLPECFAHPRLIALRLKKHGTLLLFPDALSHREHRHLRTRLLHPHDPLSAT